MTNEPTRDGSLRRNPIGRFFTWDEDNLHDNRSMVSRCDGTDAPFRSPDGIC
jgi:hypothetical protein